MIAPTSVPTWKPGRPALAHDNQLIRPEAISEAWQSRRLLLVGEAYGFPQGALAIGSRRPMAYQRRKQPLSARRIGRRLRDLRLDQARYQVANCVASAHRLRRPGRSRRSGFPRSVVHEFLQFIPRDAEIA